MSFSFKIKKNEEQTRARLGEIKTPHGVIQTPVFMPVGTQATVKAMRPDELKGMGAQIILGNTYHLHVRPGEDLIRSLGGLHRFMNWDGPLLTDSGGFQVFSLGREPQERQVPRDEANASKRNTKLAKVTDDGVEFQSHIDGSLRFMTPEKSIEIQESLGADIIMAFDECLPAGASFKETKASVDRSINWEQRSLIAKTRQDQALFAIIQGGMFPELRKECLERLIELSGSRFEGFAIGGLSVGEPIPQMVEMVDLCAPLIPETHPRYLMGVGMPEDIITCIDLGIDMFDCVIPTRNARNGQLFTSTGSIQIKQSQYTKDARPIDDECECVTCSSYSRAYLRHLHLANEILSSILSTIHNLHYYLNLLQQARSAIKAGIFLQFKKDFFRKRESHL